MPDNQGFTAHHNEWFGGVFSQGPQAFAIASRKNHGLFHCWMIPQKVRPSTVRSEEHTSELQSRGHLVCRLLLEKKKKLLIMYNQMPHQKNVLMHIYPQKEAKNQ